MEEKWVQCPAVRITFPEPIGGYWDGGKKRGGTFTPDHFSGLYGGVHPGPGRTIKWGCFHLNFWFTTGSGRTWKEAAAIAKRWLERRSPPGSKLEVKWEERAA